MNPIQKTGFGPVPGAIGQDLAVGGARIGEAALVVQDRNEIQCVLGGGLEKMFDAVELPPRFDPLGDVMVMDHHEERVLQNVAGGEAEPSRVPIRGPWVVQRELWNLTLQHLHEPEGHNGDIAIG